MGNYCVSAAQLLQSLAIDREIIMITPSVVLTDNRVFSSHLSFSLCDL